MVLPLIGAALGAGSSLYSAFLGADAADEANQTNWAINLYNSQQQERARQDAQAYAEKIRGENKLGAVDQYGNRTYFDPVKGWVSELSPQQQELLDYFYKNELPERRAQFQREASRSRVNDDEATQTLDEYNRVQKENPADLERQLYAKATRGISEAGDNNMEAALRQAARTGNTNTGSLISEFTRQAMDARRNAEQDASLAARDTVNNEYSGERGKLAQLYQMFMQGAGADLGASLDPQSVQNKNSTAQLQNAASQGNSMGANAAAMTGGTLRDVEPMNGQANAWASAGGTINSALNRMGSYFDKNQNNALMEQFLSGGGQLDFGDGGFFGRTTDRLNYGKSLF